MTEKNWIPFARPDLGAAEEAAVLRCMRSGWLTTGPEVAALEQRFAALLGVRHVIGVSSCTAAMHLALEGLGIGPGDRVITSDFTFTATAEAIRLAGAEPVLVDVEPRTLNLDPELVRRRAAEDPRVRAVLPVHFAGQAADMETLGEIARTHGLRLIEDAAHAFPTRLGERQAGTLGDAGAFSLYVTKTLTAGEGGLLTTDDDRLAEWARRARLHGIERLPAQGARGVRDYEVTAQGYKYNLPDLAAALALPQLERAETARARRESIARFYREHLEGLPAQPLAAPGGETRHAWHLFVVRLDLAALDLDRDALIGALAEAGIGTSVHFRPLHRHRHWRESLHLTPEMFPVAEMAGQQVVSLPIYPGLSDAEIERVAETTAGLLRRHGRCGASRRQQSASRKTPDLP